MRKLQSGCFEPTIEKDSEPRIRISEDSAINTCYKVVSFLFRLPGNPVVSTCVVMKAVISQKLAQSVLTLKTECGVDFLKVHYFCEWVYQQYNHITRQAKP